VTPAELLTYEVPYHPVIDVVRYLALVLAGAVAAKAIGYLTRSRIEHYASGPAVVVVGFLAFAVLAAARQAERLGQPMLWWRLPLEIIALGHALIAVHAAEPIARGMARRIGRRARRDARGRQDS
jgi:hypothetical protein